MGWKMLYQPHADGPPGLPACSLKCVGLVQEAMKNGPVIEPLKMGGLPIMDAGLRQQMMSDMKVAVTDRLQREHPYMFPCGGCGAKLNPHTKDGIPRLFSCPKCETDYVTKFLGAGQYAFDQILVTKVSSNEHEFFNEDTGDEDGTWYTVCRRCGNDDRGDASWMGKPCPGEEDDRTVPRPTEDDSGPRGEEG